MRSCKKDARRRRIFLADFFREFPSLYFFRRLLINDSPAPLPSTPLPALPNGAVPSRADHGNDRERRKSHFVMRPQGVSLSLSQRYFSPIRDARHISCTIVKNANLAQVLSVLRFGLLTLLLSGEFCKILLQMLYRSMRVCDAGLIIFSRTNPLEQNMCTCELSEPEGM